MRLCVSIRRATLLLLACAAGASTGLRAAPQAPARDTPAQQQAQQPSGVITGRVVAADTGRPLKRARVLATAPELKDGGRAAMTDESGVYEIAGLPAGRFTVTASKAAYVGLSYGQRRPLQPGTPLQLGDRQELKGVDFRLPKGGVIAGQLLDENGDPLPGAGVRALEYRSQQGARRLVAAGGAQTDDRGEFRIWGLMPGTYYIAATARNFGGRFGFRGPGGGFGPFAGPRDEADSVAYAPTYYPGVGSITEARAITIGVSQQMLDANFAVQLVHVARVTGHVLNPDGTAVTAGSVSLMPDVPGDRPGMMGMNYGGRIDWDGSFELSNVPPARYRFSARSDDSVEPQFAIQPLTVSEDIPDLVVMLAAAGSLRGSIRFVGAQDSAAINPTDVRVGALAVDPSAFAQSVFARVEKDGTFAINGVPAGPRLIRASGIPRQWTLKSVLAGGREVSDTPIDVRSGETLAGITLVFSDTTTELDGVVTDDHDVPVTELTVLAFPADDSLWHPLSRHIMTARPDQNGKFVIRGLPAGDYYVTTVDPAEPGEWYDPSFLDAHRADAARVALADGDVKTQNFKIAAR